MSRALKLSLLENLDGSLKCVVLNPTTRNIIRKKDKDHYNILTHIYGI